MLFNNSWENIFQAYIYIYINNATQRIKIQFLLYINDIISPIDDDDKFGLRDALSKPARRLRRTTQTKTLPRYIKKRYHADYKQKQNNDRIRET